MLEMLAGLVFHAALGVASVIAGISVTAALAGQGVEQIFALGQFAEAKIEDAGAVPVDQHNAQQRGRAQKVGNRFEMKMAVQEKLRTRKAGGQIIFAPEAVSGAGEHGLAVSPVAAQFGRQAQDAIQVGASSCLSCLYLSTVRNASRTRSLMRIVSSLCALLRGVDGWK